MAGTAAAAGSPGPEHPVAPGPGERGGAGGQAAARWFDSHCHLQEQYLPEEGDPAASEAVLAAALARARTEGVDRLVCIGTDPTTSAQALAMARAARDHRWPGAPRVWATAGVHPHEAGAGTAGLRALLDAWAADPDDALVGVGECGLDYFYEHSPRPAQREVFAEQIGLAQRLGLALVIHARDAWDDLFDVLAAEGVPDRTVLHCFTGGPTEARRCLNAGMVLSFSGVVTFKNAADVRAAAELCPLDRLLVETDSPFLTPVPFRGTPNEPARVPLVGAAVAAVKGCTAAEVAAASAAAAAAVFAVPAPGDAGSGPIP